MQVAVIGGGVIGVCTAYFLAEAGHQVVVIERLSNVGDGASFGSAGIIAPGYVTPWAAPGMPRKLLQSLFRPDSPLLLRPSADAALWRWLRLWKSECELERYRINRDRMRRVTGYSRELLHQIRDLHHIDYEQTQGYLQLFRAERDVLLAEPGIALLAEHDVPHSLLDPDAVRAIEPGLASATPLVGGIYLPEDEAGNCPLFTKQLRTVAQANGVEFRFGSTVKSIGRNGSQVSLQVDDLLFSVDAAVIAAGAESLPLMAQLGIDIPLFPVKGYSATATIKHFDAAPRAAVMDESFQVSIARMGSRIRVSGITEIGARGMDLHDAAIRTLVKVGEDWFPDAANFNTANFWCGARAVLPDGAPLLGQSPMKGVYLNVGHGSTGWAMAAGAGKAVADLVSGRKPDIDMDGLTLSRYRG
ncbi:MAG: D-amino acid dehydrogenase [Herminiimonas sp.]|nr:D-amino acid dehydrogenase [Herminiimonas sp.]